MTRYLDTSNFVKLYVDEPDACDIEQLVIDADVLVTSSLTYAEARATFARRRRERLLTPKELTRVVQQLDDDWGRFLVIAASNDLAIAAGRLAQVHGLRGADAIQLASFEQLLSHCEDDDVRFSCADDQLSKAARDLG